MAAGALAYLSTSKNEKVISMTAILKIGLLVREFTYPAETTFPFIITSPIVSPSHGTGTIVSGSITAKFSSNG